MQPTVGKIICVDQVQIFHCKKANNKRIKQDKY